MDRDRDRRHDRDNIPPEDRFGSGGGQSYRPSNARRTPPPSRPGGDSYRARSPPPPRRGEYAESYKADTYRAPRPRSRSPLRRPDDRLPPRRDDDNRVLPRRDDFRRRSPTPPRFRDDRQGVPRGGDSYRGRPRSPPPRREDLPRDDLFRREPARDERDFHDTPEFRDGRDRQHLPPTRSPPPLRYKERSPVALKRPREPSPGSTRDRRSPPPPKRERLASPPHMRYDEYPGSRGVSPPRRRFSPEPRRERAGYSPSQAGVTRNYRLRSRSPLARNERVDPRSVDDWRRPRSPIKDTRQDYLSREESAANSTATSRLSTPPIHPSRMAQLPAEERLPARGPPRDPYDDRELYRAPAVSLRDGDDDRGYFNGKDLEPVLLGRELGRDDDASVPVARAPPTGPSSQRNVSMAPPTGPSTAISTPSGPRAVGAPPAGPRGGPAARGEYAPRGRGGFGGEFAPRGRGSFSASFRGGRGGAPPTGPGAGFSARPVSETFNPPVAPVTNAQPPSGPRSSLSQAPPPSAPAAFSRQSSTASASYSRNDRLNSSNGTAPVVPDAPTGPKASRRPTMHDIHVVNTPLAPRQHPALADLPKYVEGGQKAEPLIDRTKLNKLEDEADKLRRQIEDKEQKKRKSLREWDRMTRETEAAALRSELAEQALRAINGEAESQAAF